MSEEKNTPPTGETKGLLNSEQSAEFVISILMFTEYDPVAIPLFVTALYFINHHLGIVSNDDVINHVAGYLIQDKHESEINDIESIRSLASACIKTVQDSFNETSHRKEGKRYIYAHIIDAIVMQDIKSIEYAKKSETPYTPYLLLGHILDIKDKGKETPTPVPEMNKLLDALYYYVKKTTDAELEADFGFRRESIEFFRKKLNTIIDQHHIQKSLRDSNFLP